MGCPRIRRHPFTEGSQVRPRSLARASRSGGTDLSGAPTIPRHRPPQDGPAPGLQALPTTPGTDRIRDPRYRPRPRSHGPSGRSQRAGKRGYRGSSPSCPHCGDAARFVAYRPKGVVSLLGTIRPDRAYYHCKACQKGHCPGDHDLGLDAGDLTPGATQAVGIAGVVGSFAVAAEDVSPRLAGLTLSESTVQRTTEAVGRHVEGLLSEGHTFGPDRPWAWHKDAGGPTCASVSIDATGVPQQGPEGAAADARMATVAMVYSPVPEDPQQWAKPSGARPPWQARYLASLQGQASLGGPLRRQATQVGMDSARRWIGLSDGGSGLEDWLGTHFGRLDAVILDFYHASEYLRELAKAIHGVGTEAAQVCHRRWAHRLKHEGGEVMLEEVRGQAPPSRGPAHEVWEATVRYVEDQVHRMDYPTDRAKGWQIGSGPIESACKRVVGRRLKCAGMRRGEPGSDGVCHLRALFLSEEGQWDAFWAERRSAA